MHLLLLIHKICHDNRKSPIDTIKHSANQSMNNEIAFQGKETTRQHFCSGDIYRDLDTCTWANDAKMLNMFKSRLLVGST